MRPVVAVLVIVVAAGAMAACGSTRPSKYYQLEVPETPPAASNAWPVALLLGRISAPHVYRDDRIVYRTGPGQLGTYEYHRWAEPPTEMLEAVLLRMLRASGRYRTVQPLHSNARGDFILRGRLHHFEEVSDGSLGARVAFEMELYEPKTGTTVWTHFYSSEEPVQGKEVAQVVQALDHNVKRGLQEVTTGLEQYFSVHPPK